MRRGLSLIQHLNIILCSIKKRSMNRQWGQSLVGMRQQNDLILRDFSKGKRKGEREKSNIFDGVRHTGWG